MNSRDAVAEIIRLNTGTKAKTEEIWKAWDISSPKYEKIFVDFAAEVQEEYRQKVRGQITSLYGVYENNSEYGKVLGLKQALDLPALRDPEPEPSEAAMRAMHRLFPLSTQDPIWLAAKARIIDEEVKKGAANPNA